MEFSRWKNIFVIVVAIEVLAAGASFVLQAKVNFTDRSIDVSSNSVSANDMQKPLPLPPPQKLSNPPDIIKAVYVTGYSAGSSKYLNYLNNILKTTEINAVVVDVKGSSGYVSYNAEIPDVQKYNLYNGAIKNIDALVRFFHDQNIYVIGRIAVFEDPIYSKARPELAVHNTLETTDQTHPVLWQDNNGLSWMDPASKDAWDYNLSLAKNVFYHGFDEVNFDYVRFPSDGKTSNMDFPVWDGKTFKYKIIEQFFEYTRQNLQGEKISADLFGQTTTNTDDMGIGQIIETAFENFDYIAPMVYPSHYITNFMGFANPADHPYEIIKYSMGTALAREQTYLKNKQDLFIKNNQAVNSSSAEAQAPLPIFPKINLAKFRPWLQDFNMGAFYTADMVKSEIKATQDALGDNFKGFMLWNPSNIYTEGAVLKDASASPN